MPALRIFDLSGGLQTKTSRFLMRQNEVLTAKNVVFDKIGGVRRRAGYVQAGNAVPANSMITSMYTYTKPNGISYQMVNAGEYLYARQVWPQMGSWTLLTSGLNGLSAHFTTFLGQAFIVTGQDHPMTWDGSTLVKTDSGNVNGAPWGEFIETYLDRVYIAKTSARRARVYFSSIPDPTGSSISWNTADGTGDYFETGKGPITGLSKNSNRLLIFEPDRLLRWDTHSLVVVSDDIGAYKQETIANWQNYTFFFHKSPKSGLSGVYRYGGGYPILISQKIQEVIDALGDVSDDVCSAVFGTHYYLRLKHLLLDYDIMANNWTVHDLAWNPLAFAVARGTSQNKLYMTIDHNSAPNVVMEFGTGNTDNGVAIHAELETRWYFPAGPETTCSFQEVHVFGDNLQNAQISFRVEGDELGEWQRIGEVRRRYGKHLFNAVGRGIQFKVTQGNAADPFFLEGFVVIYEPEGVR